MQSQVKTPWSVVGAGPAGLTAASRWRVPASRRSCWSGGPTRRVCRGRPDQHVDDGADALVGPRGEVREGDLEVELQPWVTETLATASAGYALDAGFPTREQSALISPTAPAGMPQDHLEPVLERHLRSLETTRVERGTEVIEIRHAGDGVMLTSERSRGAMSAGSAPAT